MRPRFKIHLGTIPHTLSPTYTGCGQTVLLDTRVTEDRQLVTCQSCLNAMAPDAAA